MYQGAGTDRCAHAREAHALSNYCASPSVGCNCDKSDDNIDVWSEDSGLVTNKAHLSVSQLRFEDTNGDEEEGYHALGGTNMLWND